MPPKNKQLEERQRKRRLARFRFKSLIRKVIINNYWLSELEDQKLGDNVNRNAAIITRRKPRTEQSLTIIDKTILNTPEYERTKEQVHKLVPIFLDLPCFASFPPAARALLAQCCYFNFVNKDRIILKEGHVGSAIYFIIFGEVSIWKKMWNYETEKVEDMLIGSKEMGEMFGELAILKKQPRAVTVSAETDCELLVVYQDDFKRILASTLQRQWDQVQLSMNRFEYFSYWSEHQKQEACILGRVKKFRPNEVIYGDKKGMRTFGHFILSGTCAVLQMLQMKRTKLKHGSRLELLPADHPIEPNDATVEHQFVNVGYLTCGGVFGLGENLQHKTIVAQNTVYCLLLPKYWLFQKAQNKGNIWERIRLYLDATVPTRDSAFQDYLGECKWKKYRKDLVESVLTDSKIPNPTNYFDIPLICRVYGK